MISSTGSTSSRQRNGNSLLPKVSIIIPTKNRFSFLHEAVESVREQTYTEWEAIVVDDGSTDGTIEEMLALSRKDPRIRFVKRSSPRSGAPACRNQGVAISTGEYVVFFDSDDCLAPLCLENRVRVMEADPSLDFAVFPCELFRSKPGDMPVLWNIDTEENDIDRFLRFDVPWGLHCVMWRRTSAMRVGPWDESLLSWQDWELHLRAIIKRLNYKSFPGRDCFWRVTHKGSIGSKSVTADHFGSHERLLSKVYDMLSKSHLLDRKRRYLVAGLYFWLAEGWIYNGKKAEAVRVWTVAQERGLIRCIEYWESLLYFKFWGFQLARRVARKYFLTIRWHRNTTLRGSQTFRKIPSIHHTDVGTLKHKR
jgi:glycosyltransferase involved in cell wall biosynthesis